MSVSEEDRSPTYRSAMPPPTAPAAVPAPTYRSIAMPHPSIPAKASTSEAAGAPATSATAEAPPLPPGWTACYHSELRATCYVHTVSRTCTWSRPQVVDTDTPEELTAPDEEGPLLSQSALEEQRALRELNDRRREREYSAEQSTPQERLQRELNYRPGVRYSTFKFASSGNQKMGLEAFRLLRSYCWDVLGARLDFDERKEEGSWPYEAPTRSTLRLLGLVVSEGLSAGWGAP